jgi:hypoxanthine phosphoribosyltransferase
MDAEIDFMRLKSYDGQDNSAGVKLLKDIELDVTDRHVYLVDDIIDTGATTNYAIDLIKSRNAVSVSTVTLFKRLWGPTSNFNGIEIDDQWIYGYGLDDNGLFRNINRVVYKNFKKD